jgi:hypothetical protein
MDNKPEYGIQKFQCPHCLVVAQQTWLSSYQLSSEVFSIYNHIYLSYRAKIRDYQQEAIRGFLDTAKNQFPNDFNSYLARDLSIATCGSCGRYSLWVDKEMVFPVEMPIDLPNPDLNEGIRSLYNEASKIFLDSPRGSTALLRLALQMLLKQIGKEGKDINNDIKELVADGLSSKIQKALDLLRVVGNNAVHPGQISFDDNSEVALKLFKILNIIADEMISKPREIDKLYENVVPDETKGHIAKRDKKSG